MAADGTSRDALVEVLEAHIQGRWSDSTYGCRGCANRINDEGLKVDPSNVKALQKIWARYNAASHPEWTHRQWAEHVAGALLDAVVMPLVQERDRLRSHFDIAAADAESAWAQHDAAIKRAEAAEAELERLHSWRGLLSLMDEHWPENVFPTLTDDPARDTGPRLVSALRRAEAAEAERDLLEAERDQALAELDEWQATR